MNSIIIDFIANEKYNKTFQWQRLTTDKEAFISLIKDCHGGGYVLYSYELWFDKIECDLWCRTKAKAARNGYWMFATGENWVRKETSFYSGKVDSTTICTLDIFPMLCTWTWVQVNLSFPNGTWLHYKNMIFNSSDGVTSRVYSYLYELIPIYPR